MVDCQREDKAVAGILGSNTAVQRPNVPVHLALALPRTDRDRFRIELTPSPSPRCSPVGIHCGVRSRPAYTGHDTEEQGCPGVPGPDPV